MTIFEILKFNRELLNRFRQSGIRLEDADYIDLFVDFDRMISDGEKVSYAVACVAARYRISERKVYSLIKRFQSDCNPGAV
jgi:hypothetical protein|nr:MAG TPA: hypothetical protein [Caudoviricetes sp.]